MRPMKDNPYQMKYKTTDDGWDRWKNPYQMVYETTVDEWDRWSNPYQMMHKTTVDGWNQWGNTQTTWGTKHMLMDETGEGIHTRYCAKQVLMDETNEGIPIPHEVQNNCWWMTTDERVHTSMMYKTNVDGWDRQRNPYHMMTKQLLTDETNEGLSIPDEIQNNCWWMRQMRKSIPDSVQNNCWWLRPMKDYQY